jgi:hypothetical protein
LVFSVTGQRVSDRVRELVLRVGVGVVQLSCDGQRGCRCHWHGSGCCHWQRSGGHGCSTHYRCGGRERCESGQRSRGGETSGSGRIHLLQRGCNSSGSGRQQGRFERVRCVRVCGGGGRVRQESGIGGVRGRCDLDTSLGSADGSDGDDGEDQCRL